MLRIQRSDEGGAPVFSLCGRIEQGHVAELQNLLAGEEQLTQITLDLQEVRLVDRDVVRFLAECEARGIKLKDCPAYVREWMETGRV